MSENQLYLHDPEADFDYYDDYVPASPADLIAAVRRGVESGTIEGTEPDYERADAAFRIALATKGIEVEGLPTAQVSRAIVDAAIGGRLVIPVDGEET